MLLMLDLNLGRPRFKSTLNQGTSWNIFGSATISIVSSFLTVERTQVVSVQTNAVEQNQLTNVNSPLYLNITIF